jgi:hypothetical protein
MDGTKIVNRTGPKEFGIDAGDGAGESAAALDAPAQLDHHQLAPERRPISHFLTFLL